MASFNKFEIFAKDVGNGVHNLGSDALTLALSDTAPDAATNETVADLTLITEQNGYTATALSNVSFTESGGTASLSADDVTWTASGGSFGPFRYVILYNDTPSSPADPLIGYWDYGSSITVADGESFVADFGTTILTIS